MCNAPNKDNKFSEISVLAGPAGPKNTLPFPRLYTCASALITCAIITSRTSLPCDPILVGFGNLDCSFA